jgi:squalene-hopene/tetraprenyl-beta-curcumene cyclase
MLQGVSRTFALTIPVLPAGLVEVVANAYLLCRIVDTIEDEPALSASSKRDLCEHFVRAIAGSDSADRFASRLAPLLSAQTSASAQELIRETPRVLGITHRFTPSQKDALRTCVHVMGQGMVHFQERGSAAGLNDLAELGSYCYHVAGVVGEMLTRLFCEYSPAIAANRDALMRLAVSFGQGLQMTNILKDIWDDRARGFCWLPRDQFPGLDLGRLAPGVCGNSFERGLLHLVAIAHGHLQNALRYTLLIPTHETGIRNFCLWALGMAVLTLRKIQRHPGFTSGDQVKISRRSVRVTVALSRLTARRDLALRMLFRWAETGLPFVPAELPSPPPATEALEEQRAPVIAQRLEEAVQLAHAALVADQHADGYWCYELEADCTIPAEYVMMMHYMADIDSALQAKIAVYIRERQSSHGGWSLYHGGAFDLSCSVKAYFALKLAGDDVHALHMKRARDAILAHGGAARTNVFTRIALALFGEIPWRAVPYIPVEIVLLPRWFPFHLSKVSYWSRTVLVPLLVLCTLKPRARNPLDIHLRELFVTAPELEPNYFPVRSGLNRAFLLLDRLGRGLDRWVPRWIRRHALKRAESWFVERLNATGGLGAIFPAMVNAYEALDCLGYPADHALRGSTRDAIDRLLVVGESSAYCQPCVPPVWDTALACLALQELASNDPAVDRALDWLQTQQLLEQPGDWRESRPNLPGGGWPFQFRNDYYPDIDDTSAVAWTMDASNQPKYRDTVRRAIQWICGMQSRNGGFGAFDVDNTHYSLNEIPFADHGALLDPPTADVSARCVCLLARSPKTDRRAQRALQAVLRYLRAAQEPFGAWFGRWGTNYVYGTWSALAAFEQAGISSADPAMQRAVRWLKRIQRPDGGWAEDNDSYLRPETAGTGRESTAFQTAWAMLGLMAAGETTCTELHRGAEFLLHTQRPDGLWEEPWFTAPGFPRVFYLKYHGYSKYFPLWALARYRKVCERA